MDLDLPFTPAVKRLITVCALLALALTGFADVALLAMAPDPWHPATNWLPVLVTGPLLILAVGDTRFSPPLLPRIWMVVAMSLTLSGICVAVPQTGSSVGALEIAGLLGLLLRTAARTARPKAAAASAAALSVTVLVLPFRTGSWASIVAGVYMLTVILAIVITLGCAIRAMEARRRRAITDVRQAERLALARDLHDLIAHHMTGIIVQAHAATAVYPTAPDKVEPILRNIAQAGTETLESMRRLVRVLREDNHTAVRPGDLLSELLDACGGRPRTRHTRHCAPRSHRGRAYRPHQPRSGDLRLPRGPGSTHQCAQARPRRPGRRPPRRRQHLAAPQHHRHRRTPTHRCADRRPGRLRPHRPARTGRSTRRSTPHRPSARRRLGSESHLPTTCPVPGPGHPRT
ncbi:histidine kinase dimerization/phosphoacceptor domain-containing protein, partial [Streptomyces sp. P01-B04]|nr:histidine kinase dimerization/phosphoacceptor domain-containing protein [Streptomyces poriferorum]MBW5261901.1 histidine kinase dimerization/phosphoacceptor domain-containing protein [Streptomyces poriferorum]